jgi:hypothetical protein
MRLRAKRLVAAVLVTLSVAWQVVPDPDSDQPQVDSDQSAPATAVLDADAEGDNVSTAEQTQSEQSTPPVRNSRSRDGAGDRGNRTSRSAPDRSGALNRDRQSRGNTDRQRDRTARPGSASRGDRARNDRPGTNSSTNGTYAQFRIITERNIFDTTRSPRSSRQEREPRSSARVQTFTLVGTLRYEKGPYAFFDGSSPEFRKVLETGHKIAGHKITAIGQDAVTLQSGTNTLELPVGARMRREESGWHMQDEGQAVRKASAPGSSAPPSTAAGEESDIIKRLMEQREQELK